MLRVLSGRGGFQKRLFSSIKTNPRPGLLKFVDFARKKGGPADIRYFTKIVKDAKSIEDIKGLLKEAKTRFGSLDWLFLASAAFTASSHGLDDPQFSADLLKQIPKIHQPKINRGTLWRVLACASANRTYQPARIAFDILPPQHRTPTDIALLISAGIPLEEGKALVQQAISSVPPPGMNVKAVGVFLKLASHCNDFVLAQEIWRWSEPSRKATSTSELLAFITMQFLLLSGKAGRLDFCKQLWEEATIAGLAANSKVGGAMLTALSFFGGNETDDFISTISPQDITGPMLVSILTSYSHQGRPQQAWHFLQKIKSINKQIVDLRAYTSVIDGFSRRGEHKEALQILEEARRAGFEPNEITWMSILSSCRHYQELPVALEALQKIQALNPSDQTVASAYVLMADVYQACGNQEAAERLHKERLSKGLKKQRGAVQVTVQQKTYTFHVGEIPPEISSYTQRIDAKLEDWKLYLSTQGVSIESINCRHSEKLALAFAVIMGQNDVTLLKNLRICSLCHAASIKITQYEGIVIRHWDGSKRVHIMQDGVCSCDGKY